MSDSNIDQKMHVEREFIKKKKQLCMTLIFLMLLNQLFQEK